MVATAASYRRPDRRARRENRPCARLPQGHKRTKKSRSQVYSEAVAEYVARHEPDTVTEQINAVCDEVDTRPDPFVAEAARRVLADSDW